MKKKMILFLALSITLFFQNATTLGATEQAAKKNAPTPAKPAVSSCKYCLEVDSLKDQFAKIKPDSLDEATIDQQLDLVDKTASTVKKILSEKSPSTDDMKAAIKIMAIAAPFDPQHLVAENVVNLMGKKVEGIYAEISNMEKSSALSKPEAENLKVALSVSEDERVSQDPAAGKSKEKSKKKDKK